VGKRCPFVHRKLISSGSTPAIVSLLLLGMSVFGYRRNTSISMADGSRKANCKKQTKGRSIFTTSPFKLYARNMSSLDNPLKKLSNKDFAMPVRKKKYFNTKWAPLVESRCCLLYLSRRLPMSSSSRRR
jgi:hypothetical protein